MTARDITQLSITAAVVFATAALAGVAGMAWAREGAAVFRQMVIAGLPGCL